MDAVKAVIPFFLGLILVEWLLGGARLYRLNDSIADLGAGIGQQIFAVPLTALFVVIYSQLYRATALIHWSVIAASKIWSTALRRDRPAFAILPPRAPSASVAVQVDARSRSSPASAKLESR